MDYEKAYKKALERARNVHKYSSDIAEIKRMEYIFSELAESEDDKIRNFISNELTCLRATTGKGSNRYEELTNAIAWLEKQGRDKEMNNFDVLPGLYKCVHRMFDGTPDGKLLFEVGNIYKCLSKHDRAEFEVSYGHSVYLEDPVVCKHFIPYEKQGQKPAWSEEDEKTLNSILNDLSQDVIPDDEDIQWLKLLKNRVYPKQEWSEEDKERYISCLQRLGTGNPDQPETINSKWFKEHVTFLPKRKPSDEQMHYLANIKLGNSVVK